MYGTYRSTLYLLKSSNGTRFLTLVFASLFLASLGVISHDAFAHGAGPGACPNRYDGPITSFTINNGSQTFDAIANPGVTFNMDTFGSYNVTFVIHTPSQSSQGNSDNGTTWYNLNAIGFSEGVCVYGVGPDQDVTISESWGLPSQISRYHDSTGSHNFFTATTYWPGVSYTVNWIYANAVAPDAPTNLSAVAVSSSQIDLSWNAPSNDGGAYITGYKIERSTDGGTHWSTSIVNTGMTTSKYVCDNGPCHYVTTYSDTRLASDTTYTYRVSAINRIGTGPSSNTASENQVIATTPVGKFPVNTAVNPDTNRIYVSTTCCALGFTNGTNSVFVLDGATNGIESTIPFGALPSDDVGSVAVNPTTNRIYVEHNLSANPPNPEIAVIDGSTNAVIDEIQHVNGFIFINPNTDKIYLAHTQGIVVIDGSTDQVANQITTCGIMGAPSINTATDRIYVPCYKNPQGSTGKSEVQVIDASTGAVADTIPFTNESMPFVTAVNPVTNAVYVESTNTTMYVMDGNTDSVTGKINGVSIGSIAVNPSTNMIYVSNQPPSWNAVSVINGSTNQLVGQLTVGNSPDGISVNPTTNRIYVANVADGTVSVIQGRSASSASSSTSGITLNNVQSTSGTTDSSNQITLSNFNATAGADRLLVVGVSANNNNVGSITFAGVPLTREVSHFTNNDAEFWYLTNPSGIGDITVTMNGPTQAVVGAYSFSGVNQTVPIPTHITRHNLSPSSPAISITTQYPNDLVLDLPSIYGGSTLGSPTCTQQWDVNVPNAITGASSSTMVPSPTTVTCSWTASSDDMWDDAAIELRAAG